MGGLGGGVTTVGTAPWWAGRLSSVARWSTGRTVGGGTTPVLGDVDVDTDEGAGPSNWIGSTGTVGRTIKGNDNAVRDDPRSGHGHRRQRSPRPLTRKV